MEYDFWYIDLYSGYYGVISKYLFKQLDIEIYYFFTAVLEDNVL